MTLDRLINSEGDEEANSLKIEILDYYVRTYGKDYMFFHDLATGQLLTEDKKTPILDDLTGVIGNYNITSGYLTKEEAIKHMNSLECRE